MELGFVCMAIAVLAFQVQLLRMDKRLRECEHSKASLDVLADQVFELAGDFYGPDANK